MKHNDRWINLLMGIAPIPLTLVFTSLILLAMGASPWEAYRNIFNGAFSSPEKVADVFAACVPLVLCSAGLAITFAAGQWNVGVEGQIILGAIFATWAARTLAWPQVPLLAAMLLAGLLGGALWGSFAGLLKVFGKVHEIFGGLGLNYLAQALAIWLIFNPWKPAGGATMSGTDLFPEAARMPHLGHLRVAPLAVVLALIAVALVTFLLRGTRWGLELKALGKGFVSAFTLGVPATPRLLTAFAACGGMAGIAGTILCSARYIRMIPAISGGQGYLALLVALISGSSNPQWIPFIAFFFAAAGVGSPQLEYNMHLDSSLGGVLEASVVLSVMFVSGWRVLLARKRSQAAALVSAEQEVTA
ncbi:MAG: ABC transporter permease [Anaerolineae bacterium]|nr:ABC transporter permease [Anaerolineae bacterium]